MMRKSVGLRPFALGGGSSAQTSSNSASDISVEYRSRMTSYFTRSASFQGIANLPKLLQIQGIKPREASQPISGQALSLARQGRRGELQPETCPDKSQPNVLRQPRSTAVRRARCGIAMPWLLQVPMPSRATICDRLEPQ